jgi:rare lipoprotein A
MFVTKIMPRLALALAFECALASHAFVAAGETESEGKSVGDAAERTTVPAPNDRQLPPAHVDHSGRKQSGVASYYGKHFVNKKTANGERLDPEKMTAASKTLPLGTKAKVINIENGKSAEVTINDRGPYVKGRIIDVTPKAADKLGMKDEGVSPVEVKPIEVPQPDGEVKHVGD